MPTDRDLIAKHRPTLAEMAELRAAVLYSYEAGEPNLDGITSPWVRAIISQPDGGLVDVIDALAVAQRPPFAYVVVEVGEPPPWDFVPIFANLADADTAAGIAAGYEQAEFAVCEVREAQP